MNEPGRERERECQDWGLVKQVIKTLSKMVTANGTCLVGEESGSATSTNQPTKKIGATLITPAFNRQLSPILGGSRRRHNHQHHPFNSINLLIQFDTELSSGSQTNKKNNKHAFPLLQS